MICIYGKANNSQQSFTTEKESNMMTTCNIGDNGTADIMKVVINNLKNNPTTVGDLIFSLLINFYFFIHFSN